MVSLFVRVCLLTGCLVLLAGALSVPAAAPTQAAPGLAGRNCGSTVMALAQARATADGSQPQETMSWENSKRVAIGTPTAPQRTPTIAVGSNGTLNLLFTDERSGNADIYAARSTDGGASWSAGVQVSDASGTQAQTNPALWIVPDGTIHSIWNDERRGLNDIYAAYSTDGGASWSTSVRANRDNGDAAKSAPLLVGTSTVLLAGWVQTSTTGAASGDLIAVRSTDGGQTWERTDPINDIANSVFDSGFSLVADAASDRLYAAWIGIPAGGADATQVLLAWSDDGGQSWSDPMQINDPAEDALKAAPTLAVDSSNNVMLVAWEDFRQFPRQVRLVQLSNVQTMSSIQATESIQIGTDDGPAFDPRLVIDSLGTGHCIFCQENTLDGGANIYTAEIDSTNQVMLEPISDDPIGSSQSLLAVAMDSQDGIYAFWTNGTPTGEGIFAARRPGTTGLPGTQYLPFVAR